MLVIYFDLTIFVDRTKLKVVRVIEKIGIALYKKNKNAILEFVK